MHATVLQTRLLFTNHHISYCNTGKILKQPGPKLIDLLVTGCKKRKQFHEVGAEGD